MTKPKFSFFWFILLFLLGGIPALIYLFIYILRSLRYGISYLFAPQSNGLIGFFQLEDWWKSLSKKERKTLVKVYNDSQSIKNLLYKGNVTYSDYNKNELLLELAARTKLPDLKLRIADKVLLEMRKTRRKTTDEYFTCGELVRMYKSLKKLYPECEDKFFEAANLQIKIGKFVRPYLGKPLTIPCLAYDELIIYFRAQKNLEAVKKMQDAALEDGWRIKEYSKGLGVRD